MQKFRTAVTRITTINDKTSNKADIAGRTWNDLRQLVKKKGDPRVEKPRFLDPADIPFTDEDMLAPEPLSDSGNDDED